jgi:hypothetical protein
LLQKSWAISHFYVEYVLNLLENMFVAIYTEETSNESLLGKKKS